MDEVLADLRRGRTPLHKVEVPAPAPPCTSLNEHILAAIRQGVTLKKVHPDLGPRKPASDLETSIKAALQRIQRVSADSEEEEEEEEEDEGEEGEEDSPGEWDH